MVQLIAAGVRAQVSPVLVKVEEMKILAGPSSIFNPSCCHLQRWGFSQPGVMVLVNSSSYPELPLKWPIAF